MIQNSKIIAVGVAANTLFEKSIPSNTQQYVKIIIEFEKTIPSNTQGREKKHDINRRIYTRYISRNTIVYRTRYLTVSNCFFCRIQRTRKEGNTDVSYSCSSYMGIYGVLFETYTILYLPIFSPNTEKYGTKNTHIHDSFTQ